MNGVVLDEISERSKVVYQGPPASLIGIGMGAPTNTASAPPRSLKSSPWELPGDSSEAVLIGPVENAA